MSAPRTQRREAETAPIAGPVLYPGGDRGRRSCSEADHVPVEAPVSAGWTGERHPSVGAGHGADPEELVEYSPGSPPAD